MKNFCFFQICLQLMTCSLGLWSLSSYASPFNPNVIQGTLAIENIDPQTYVLSVSDETFIYCDDFSIAEGELIEIQQPSSQSIVIIEVITKMPSLLLGTLKSNGFVFLLNSNGVLIGENGYIDTYGFLTSTLPVCPCPFIDGEQDVFIQGDSKASIVNKGRIKAWENDTYLIGHKIENRGVIDASQGTVALAAGRDIILNQSNGQKVGAFPSPIKYESEDTGIDNSGMIIGSKTELKADGNSYAIAIRHSGFIDIIGTEEQKGEAYLVSEQGDTIVTGAITVENLNQTGGEIHILGEHIFLFDNSNIDVSGDRGGGKIFIGGDVEPNRGVITKMTFIDKDASILADALENGNGGKVIICSDEATYFYGAISACGGENSGDGGIVEISGKKNLDFQGVADLFAPHGKEGILLLNTCAI
jgi:filamentous hemagglutinin family protein